MQLVLVFKINEFMTVLKDKPIANLWFAVNKNSMYIK